VNLAEQLRANRLVAIVRGTDREAALQSVLALVDAGIGMVEDAFDLAAVDVDFAGDGALAEACLVSRADGLLQGWCNREFRRCFLFQRRCRLVLRFGLGLARSRALPGADQHHQQFE
jgi:hypothetical protein